MKTENGRDGKRNHQSGEVLTACLIGLAIGAVAALVHYNSFAQQRANELGMEYGAADYFAESPVTAIGLPIAGALAGAGVGALINGFNNDNNDSSSSTREINIHAEEGQEGEITVNMTETPTTTTTTTTTETSDRHDTQNNSNGDGDR
jgi:flagellar basal body-associated protein FliL